MIQDDAHIASSMYTGSVITGILGYDESPTDPSEAFRIASEGVNQELDQKWFPTWGFANTYAFMVRPDTMEEYNLGTISDIEALAGDLVAGVD